MIEELKIDMKKLIALFEEMANAPREDLGKRTPGERQAREIYAERHQND